MMIRKHLGTFLAYVINCGFTKRYYYLRIKNNLLCIVCDAKNVQQINFFGLDSNAFNHFVMFGQVCDFAAAKQTNASDLFKCVQCPWRYFEFNIILYWFKVQAVWIAHNNVNVHTKNMQITHTYSIHSILVRSFFCAISLLFDENVSEIQLIFGCTNLFSVLEAIRSATQTQWDAIGNWICALRSFE